MALSPWALRMLQNAQAISSAVNKQREDTQASQEAAETKKPKYQVEQDDETGTTTIKMKVPQKSFRNLAEQTAQSQFVNAPAPVDYNALAQQNQAYQGAGMPLPPTGASEGGGFLGTLKNIGKSIGAGGGPFQNWDRRRGIGNLLPMINAFATGQAYREQNYQNAMTDWRKESFNIQEAIKRNDIDLKQAEQALQMNNMKYQQTVDEIARQNEKVPIDDLLSMSGYGPSATQEMVEKFRQMPGATQDIGGRTYITRQAFAETMNLIQEGQKTELGGMQVEKMKQERNLQDLNNEAANLTAQIQQMKSTDKGRADVQAKLNEINGKIKAIVNSDVDLQRRMALEQLQYEHRQNLKKLEEDKQARLMELRDKINSTGGKVGKQRAQTELRNLTTQYRQAQQNVMAWEQFNNLPPEQQQQLSIMGQAPEPADAKVLKMYRALAAPLMPNLPPFEQKEFSEAMGIPIQKPYEGAETSPPAPTGGKSNPSRDEVMAERESIKNTLKAQFPGESEEWYKVNAAKGQRKLNANRR